jgi:hypothetical protein
VPFQNSAAIGVSQHDMKPCPFKTTASIQNNRIHSKQPHPFKTTASIQNNRIHSKQSRDFKNNSVKLQVGAES